MRKLFNQLFGTRYVILFDTDGEIRIVRVRELGNHLVYTERDNEGSKIIELLPDGTAPGSEYVKTWEWLYGGIKWK